MRLKKVIGRKGCLPSILAKCATPLYVRQGYVRCSCVVLPDKALITEDEGIARAALEAGGEVLLVKKADILLPGYDRGFIGGCCAVLEDKVLFFGRIEDHPSYAMIADFLSSRGCEAISLFDAPLRDCGGVCAVKRG